MSNLQQEVLNSLEALKQKNAQEELTLDDLELLFIASLLEELSNAG